MSFLSKIRPNSKSAGGPAAATGKEAKQAHLVARVYRLLSSIRTSLCLLGATAFFYALGTVFPQGLGLDEYAAAGGRLVFLVKVFGLLDIFSSPLFVLTVLALLVNLAVCTCDRYFTLRAARAVPSDIKPDQTILLTQGILDAKIDVRRVIRELGFRVSSKDTEWVVMEKGLPQNLLSWLYHVGIAVCIIGILLTYLFAYEDTVTLWPETPEAIAPGSGGRVQRLLNKPPAVTGWSIVLDKLSTGYVERPELNYPKDRSSRLAIGLGWKEPEYEIKDEIVLSDLKSAVRVITDRASTAGTIEANGPFKYGRYTFYQTGYEQVLKINIDGSPVQIEARPDTEISVPGITPPLIFRTLRSGALHRLDGGMKKIDPYTTVASSIDINGRKEHVDVGILSIDGALDVEGRTLTLAGFRQGSVLSYRFDPGVKVLWMGGAFVLLVMFTRFYGSWYLVAYNLDETDGIVALNLHISTRGIIADRKRLSDRIEHYLTKDDLRLPPLS